MQKKAVLPFLFLLSTLAGLISHTPPVYSGITSLDSWPFAAANSISHTPVGTVWGANKITRPDLGTAKIHPIKSLLPQVRTQLAQKIMQRSTHVFHEVWIAVCFGELCPLELRLLVTYPYFDL
jgi:hypothetical protein